MNDHQEGSPDLAGVLAVLASILAVVLVGVATVTDRPILLGAAAVVVAVAITLVILRRSTARRFPGPVGHPAADHATGRGLRVEADTDLDTEGDGDGSGRRYRDEAVTARADLLATLRHGFRSGADLGSDHDEPPTHPEAQLRPEPEPEVEPEPEPEVDTDPASVDAPAPPDDPSPPASPTAVAPRSFDDLRSVAPTGPAPSAPDDPSDPLIDSATGLFTQGFFEASLPKRVSAARRGLRPLSLAVVDVVVGRPVAEAITADRATVAEAMIEVFRDADTIAIAHGGEFLVLLEDTPEAGAVWTLERLRRHLTATDPDLTMWAGVSCYPAYSFDADELIAQACDALASARQWQQDRIEIAAYAAD